MRINSTHSTHRIYNMYNSWQTCIICEHDTYNGFALTRELLEKKKTRFSFTNPVALFISSNSDEVDKFLVTAAIPWIKYKLINVLSIHWFSSSILLLVNHNHYNALHDFYVQLLLRAKKIILFFQNLFKLRQAMSYFSFTWLPNPTSENLSNISWYIKMWPL